MLDSSKPKPSMVDAALYYAGLGIPVFPLNVLEKDPWPGSHGLKDATTNGDQIRRWWGACPEANIGGACGPVFEVLDIDEGGDEELLKHEPIEDTPQVRTASGGTHLYMAPCGVRTKGRVRFAAGLDWRAAGKNYVVMPPSRSMEGSWKWTRKLNGHFAPVPDWIIEACREPEEDAEPDGNGVEMSSAGESALPPQEIGKGARNDTLFRLACRLRHSGLDPDEILCALTALNVKRVRPKLSEADIRKIAGSAAKYQASEVPDADLAIPEEARSGWIGDFQTEGESTGVHSGVWLIDGRTIMHGFPDAQMSLITGYTGAGKTSLMVQCALNIARSGVTVGYATFADFTVANIYDRLVTQVCGWNGAKAPTKSEELYDQWAAARAEVNKLPILMYDSSEMKRGREVEPFIEWLQAHPYLRIVFVDYAQEMRTQNRKLQGLDRAEECCGLVRWYAAQSGLPVVVGSQITEGNEKQGTRDITKGSRVWEERAALHVIVKRFETEKEIARLPAEYQGIENMTLLRIAKNRFGKKGEAWAQWSDKFLKFIEFEEEDPYADS